MRSVARRAVALISSMSGAKGVVRLEVVDDHLRVAQDHGQDVVEVVRDSSGEAPDGLHLLRLTKLLLEPLPVTDVTDGARYKHTFFRL